MGLPQPLEDYIRNMVSYSIGSSSLPSEFLMEKLQHTEDRRRALESQVFSLQNQIADLDRRMALSKEEAAMNAKGLNRQVSETVRLKAEVRQAADRCAFLEEECLLYHKDRDVFMAAVEEAEERYAEAQEQLSAALESIEKIKAENGSEIVRLGSRIQHLEAENSLLQKKLSDSEERARQRSEKDESLESSTSAIAAGSDVVLSKSGSVEGCHVCNQKSQVIPELMSEIQRLWSEIVVYKKNQARADAQIRILMDENRDLKSTIRKNITSSASTMSPSPAAKKGKIMMDKSHKRPSHSHHHPHIRQPLQLLDSNSRESSDI